MPVAVGSVVGSEGQSESQFAVSESAPSPVGERPVERVGVSEGQVKASLQPLRARPLGPMAH